ATESFKTSCPTPGTNARHASPPDDHVYDRPTEPRMRGNLDPADIAFVIRSGYCQRAARPRTHPQAADTSDRNGTERTHPGSAVRMIATRETRMRRKPGVARNAQPARLLTVNVRGREVVGRPYGSQLVVERRRQRRQWKPSQ